LGQKEIFPCCAETKDENACELAAREDPKVVIEVDDIQTSRVDSKKLLAGLSNWNWDWRA
jgi:hypothetical protein